MIGRKPMHGTDHMLLAQITDTHMLPPGQLAYGEVDTAIALRAAVKALNASKPDLVLHTGDFAHHGAPEAYALALDILADLDAPFYAIPGNHDDRANMRAAFADTAWMPEKSTPDAFIHYEIDAGPVRILALDSMIPGQGGGELCAARLDWLKARLDEDSARPTIVALHHPPFPSGLDGFSKIGLGNSDLLATLLADYPNVQRVIAGHNHRSITGMCGPVPAVVAPSASYPFAFDTRVGAPLAISFEAPGLAFHLWREDLGMLSHSMAIADIPAPKPLLKNGKLLMPEATKG